MKSIQETLQEVVNQSSSHSLQSRRNFLLELLISDGTFNREELREIEIALSLVTEAELAKIELDIHHGVNTLRIVTELVANIRLRYWSIFPCE